jgi:hypothetical protein
MRGDYAKATRILRLRLTQRVRSVNGTTRIPEVPNSNSSGRNRSLADASLVTISRPRIPFLTDVTVRIRAPEGSAICFSTQYAAMNQQQPLRHV